jgi:hypothetical protein
MHQRLPLFSAVAAPSRTFRDNRWQKPLKKGQTLRRAMALNRISLVPAPIFTALWRQSSIQILPISGVTNRFKRLTYCAHDEYFAGALRLLHLGYSHNDVRSSILTFYMKEVSRCLISMAVIF